MLEMYVSNGRKLVRHSSGPCVEQVPAICAIPLALRLELFSHALRSLHVQLIAMRRAQLLEQHRQR